MEKKYLQLAGRIGLASLSFTWGEANPPRPIVPQTSPLTEEIAYLPPYTVPTSNNLDPLEITPRRKLSNRGIDSFAQIKRNEIIPTPLEMFLEKIEPSRIVSVEQARQKRVLAGYRGLSADQISTSLLIYYPIYKGAEEKYQVPWELLFVTHLQETNFSTSPNPENSGHAGAMQRNPYLFPDQIAEQTLSGWEFLNSLFQRYRKEKGFATSDTEEIFFAADKMAKDARLILKSNPQLSWEEATLSAQYRYCAAWAADQRISLYRQTKTILNNP